MGDDSMKKQYEISFELEAKKRNRGTTLKEYADLMKKDAVEFFNEKSAKVRKPKRILDIELGDDTFKVLLESEESLTAPAKAMRAYSSYLLKNGMGELAENNALFRSTGVKETVKEIDDEQLLHILVHSIYRKNNRDKEFIAKVKELAEDMKMNG